ncbi:uncharacterized protein CG13380 [Nilaparvata lugens]|uniref:uncharacterized protein CG13380 n=1 Tax=Nilaparvata lugens TaxID=108931 RepID=UPI00193D62F4|nr:uncharacterized protein CG13380 [Nilaparvata lugens]
MNNRPNSELKSVVCPDKGKGVVKRALTKDCICELPGGVIQCTTCGSIFCGRVRVKCAQHPNTIFISDFAKCINCNAPSYYLYMAAKK